MGELTQTRKELISRRIDHAAYRRKATEALVLWVVISGMMFFTGYVLGYLHVFKHGVPEWAVKLSDHAGQKK